MKRSIALLLVLLTGCIHWPGIDNTKPPVERVPVPTAAPAQPTAKSATLFASAPKGYSVQLFWNAYQDPGATNIRVWDGSALILKVPPQSTSVVVGGLSYRVQYFWHLTAVGPGGESPASATVGYWKQNAQQPGIPTGGSAQ
jgi:hypothetical protein